MAGKSDTIGSMDMFILRPDPTGYSGLEDQLRKVLRTSVLRPAGLSKGGLISHCQSFDTDRGRVFVKTHAGPQAATMFSGEVASLKAIRETGAIRVPEPITMTELPTGGAILIMRHLQMQNISRFAGALGDQLADLHLHNLTMLKKDQKQRGKIGRCPADARGVDRFGFHTVTCCGYIPQVNEWQEDWVTFFTAQRLQPQVSLIEKDYGDRTLRGLWSELQLKVQNAFKDTAIVPSLLHGDFWEGNVAEDDAGPLLFDPGCFYGHSEYELSVGDMFGVHCSEFYSAYHRKIPRAPGFGTRHRLYQLFHCFNNWNHFGPEFRESTVTHMRSLLDVL
ncbi:fructosamine-3-kinase-like [Spea bombifrons]|uniref:fructosamine-3-kinase-like n=1 Tax=Spea bombifrons TaxID=233779 RepID=UPI0023495764|nr:fructosamine-3-kinase-like [Spea bombifrons]